MTHSRVTPQGQAMGKNAARLLLQAAILPFLGIGLALVYISALTPEITGATRLYRGASG